MTSRDLLLGIIYFIAGSAVFGALLSFVFYRLEDKEKH